MPFTDDPEAIPGANTIRKAIVRAYDSETHKADVQIVGSHPTLLSGIRVATDIPADDVQASRQCTVLFLDPINQDDALVLTIQGATPSGGGGGATTFIALTDTPGSYSGQALKGVRVNATPNALEFYDRTFPSLTDTPASLTGQADKPLMVKADETGLEFGTTWRTHRHIFEGGVQSNAPFAYTTANPFNLPEGQGSWAAFHGSPIVNWATGTMGVGTGLNFIPLVGETPYPFTLTTFLGCIAGWGVSGAWANITEAHGYKQPTPPITTYYGAVATSFGLEIENIGNINAIADVYGVKVDDTTVNTGFTRLLQLGSATTPYLRVIGQGNPAAGQTNVYVLVGNTLRHIQTKDGASIGAGDNVLVAV